MGKTGLHSQPNTITWLQLAFEEFGEINPYGFLMLLRQRADLVIVPIGGPQFPISEARGMRAAFLAPSYESIRRLFWMLNRVSAIEFTREEPSKHGKPRRFYKMVDQDWFIP